MRGFLRPRPGGCADRGARRDVPAAAERTAPHPSTTSQRSSGPLCPCFTYFRQREDHASSATAPTPTVRSDIVHPARVPSSRGHGRDSARPIRFQDEKRHPIVPRARAEAPQARNSSRCVVYRTRNRPGTPMEGDSSSSGRYSGRSRPRCPAPPSSRGVEVAAWLGSGTTMSSPDRQQRDHVAVRSARWRSDRDAEISFRVRTGRLVPRAHETRPPHATRIGHVRLAFIQSADLLSG